MFIESVSSIQKSNDKNNVMQFNYKGDSFYDIYQRCLNSKASGRPPKIEVTGLLVPINKLISGHRYRFALDGDLGVYVLNMNKALEEIARKIEWEEVTVAGQLDFKNNILDVEKINLRSASVPFKLAPLLEDQFSDTSYLERSIAQRGKIEIASEFLAS